MTYPPQQGHYGPPQPQQYGYGPPPKKNNSAVLATVMFVVVLLAGVGVTGFVAPGFFLSDDSGDSGDASGGGTGDASDSASDGGSADGAGASDGGAKSFADKLVAAANDGDVAALNEMVCEGASPAVTQAIDRMDDLDGAKLAEGRQVADDEFIAVIDFSLNGNSMIYAATLTNPGGTWCWIDFTKGTGGGSGDSAPTSEESDTGGGGDGKSTMHRFLDAVNAKDVAEATRLYCEDAIDTNAEAVIAKNPDLKLAKVDPASGTFHMAKVDGTLDGQPTRGGSMAVKLKGAGAPCVYSFAAR